ncbi:hypothetical protein HPP92_028105, partial [Vanilla planifolia]
LGSEEPMKSLAGFQDVVVETKDRSKTESEENSDGSVGEELSRDGQADLEIPMRRPSWRNFNYQELAAATNNFSHDNLIGKGGHAEVYKGCLSDGQLVAIKRLTKKDKEEERIGDFLSELGIIAHVNHPNAAQLLGFSAEGGLHMVLQFSPHGSLASLLHGSKEGLNWKVRFEIALGIAKGFAISTKDAKGALFTEISRPRTSSLRMITHHRFQTLGLPNGCQTNGITMLFFPLKAHLGETCSCKDTICVSDTWLPEYFMHGVVNEKIDVFAYGVLLLELITGRRAIDSSRQSLVIWAKPFLEANDIKRLLDPSFGDDYDAEELKRVLLVSSICIHPISTSRPCMNMVVQLLRGDPRTQELMGRASKTAVPLFDACDFEDYTRSRYLSDLHRHKQLALEQ